MIQPSKQEKKPIKFTHIGIQTDGSSCGFWVATFALLMLHGVDITSDSAKAKLAQTDIKDVRRLWGEICYSFRADDAGLHAKPVNALLAKVSDLPKQYNNKDCVSRFTF